MNLTPTNFISSFCGSEIQARLSEAVNQGYSWGFGQAGISSESLTGEGSTSKLTCFLAQFTSLGTDRGLSFWDHPQFFATWAEVSVFEITLSSLPHEPLQRGGLLQQHRKAKKTIEEVTSKMDLYSHVSESQKWHSTPFTISFFVSFFN